MTKVLECVTEKLDFHYPRLARVVFCNNTVNATTIEQLRLWDCDKPMIVASRSLARTAPVESLLNALNSAGRPAGLFTAGMQHAPLNVANELAAQIVDRDIDALITLGGSSVSDTAKAANILASYKFGKRSPTIMELQKAIRNDSVQSLSCRLISVPTTLSGGEFTPIVGITDGATKHKAVIRHDSVCSDLIILDPTLAHQTPNRLWAATGMKLIDHAVERLLARNHNLLIDAQCRHGLSLVLNLIEASIGGNAAQDEARSAMLQALWLIQSSHGNVGTGLSHALAHQFGGIYGLDHGIGSAIFLPATLRLLARTGRISSDRALLLAQAFGIEDAETLIEGVAGELETLCTRLSFPRSLSAAGVKDFNMDDVVTAVLNDPTTHSSPGQPLSNDDITSLLISVSFDNAGS